MPQLDQTGPEGKGPKTGRGLGKGSHLSEEEKIKQLGKGRGARLKAGGGPGKGRRLKYNQKETE